MIADASFRIRSFRPSDIHAALELWRSTPGIGVSEGDDPSSLRRFLRKNRRFCFVAHADIGSGGAAAAGTVLCGFDGRRGYIYHLAVRPESRRLGIARALVDRVAHELRVRGCGRCHAMVFADNELANAFWPSAGLRGRGDIGVYSLDL